MLEEVIVGGRISVENTVVMQSTDPTVCTEYSRVKNDDENPHDVQYKAFKPGEIYGNQG